MLPDFICTSSYKKSQNYPNNGMTRLRKGWIPTPSPIRLIVISSNPSKSSFIQNNLYASDAVTSRTGIIGREEELPVLAGWQTVFQPVPEMNLLCQFRKKKEQIKRQTELRDVQRRGKGDGFNRCSVYLVFIHHSQSCPILRPPGLKACKH